MNENTIDQYPIGQALKRMFEVHGEMYQSRVQRMLIEWRGERKTLADWAKETELSPATICTRLRAGWDVERALTVRINSRARPKLTYLGRTMTVEEWARETGIKAGTIFARRSKGWSDEKVLETPVAKRQQKKRIQQSELMVY